MFKYRYLIARLSAAMPQRLRAINLSRSIWPLVVWIFVIPFAIFAADDKTPIDFETQVLPLLQAKCVKCHGATNPKGELDLASIAGLRRGGESGSVIQPGNAEKSSLLEKLTSGEMPPRYRGSPSPCVCFEGTG